MLVPCPIIDVVKDPFYVLLIEQAESFMISLNCPVEAYLFTKICQPITLFGREFYRKEPRRLKLVAESISLKNKDELLATTMSLIITDSKLVISNLINHSYQPQSGLQFIFPRKNFLFHIVDLISGFIASW